MSGNQLIVNRPRLGWLYVPHDQDLKIAALLENTGSLITITVLTGGMFQDESRYSRWFSEGISFGDDPQREKYEYAPPENFVFQDVDGLVSLTGCESLGMSQSVSVGNGRIVADYAILGGRQFGYGEVSALRATIPALDSWLGISGLQEESQAEDSDGFISRTLRYQKLRTLPINESGSLTFRQSWTPRFDRSRSEYVVSGVNHVVRSAYEGGTVGWDEAMKEIVAIRDLICLAAWKRYGFGSLEVLEAVGGSEEAPGGSAKWCTVVNYVLPKCDSKRRHPNYLFTFSDLGTEGVSSWMKLRRKYSRAFDPVLTLVNVRGTYLEADMIQAGVAMEALGYQLAVEDGQIGSGKSPSHRLCLEKVATSAEFDFGFDIAEWAARAAECYRKIKHPDGDHPSAGETLRAFRENVLVFRCWLARELGISQDDLTSRLEFDPLHPSYLPEVE